MIYGHFYMVKKELHLKAYRMTKEDYPSTWVKVAIDMNIDP